MAARWPVLGSVALAHAALAWALLHGARLPAPTDATPALTWVRVAAPADSPTLPPVATAEPSLRAVVTKRTPPPVPAAPRAPAADAAPITAAAHESPAAAQGQGEPAAALAAVPAAPAQAAALMRAEAAPTLPAEHVHCPHAPHPQALRERGIEGRVLLRVHVDAQGSAGQAQVIGGSGFRLFDQAALDSALGCRFVPARRDGQPVPSWVEFAVRFALRD